MDPRLFESALSSLGEGVAIFAPGGALLWMNSAAEQLIGASAQRLVGRNYMEIFRSGPEIAAEMERVYTVGSSIIDNELLYTNMAGAQATISVSIHPMEEPGGRWVILILRDLTGLKALQRAARLREKAEETALLAAGIAHEIKNPLSGIRGAAQLVERESGSPAMAEYTGLIIRETDRINRLITGLIDLNHPMSFPMGPVNIHAVLDEALLGQKPEMEKRSVTSLRLYDPSLPPVEGNMDRLTQILVNLLKNAVEATPDGAMITIRTSPAWRLPDSAPPRKDKKYAAIEIIDEGHGIEERQMHGLFTPFFTRKQGGTGLGLTVTLNLVRAHNGLLTVKNRKDGKGAEAVVYLPFA
ncbi:MAG: ATP-binding protein [Nitrospinota bacterium]|nr:ATP-binding protein [Nitrospinota bacterium]